MKKNFFYFAFAALAAISLTACSSDDDDSNNTSGSSSPTSSLPKPANADNAALYTLPDGGLVATNPAQEEEHAPVLNSFEVTEDEQVLFQLKDADNSNVFVMDKPVVTGNKLTFNSAKIKGTIEKVETPATTRANEISVAYIINIQILFNSQWRVFTTGPRPIVVTVIRVTPIPATETVNFSLVRTWNFMKKTPTADFPAATFDVHLASSGVTAFKDFYTQDDYFDLEMILNEALSRDVALTEKEKNDMKRKIKNITFTSEKFIISYLEGADDVAAWSWMDSQKKNIKIRLLDDKMGNKFINNNTTIGVAFNENRCNLTLNVKFNDSNNKEWDSSLVAHVKYN